MDSRPDARSWRDHLWQAKMVDGTVTRPQLMTRTDQFSSVQFTITRPRLHGAGIYMRVGVPRWICREVSAPVGVRRLMSSLGMHFKRALEGRHSQDRKSKQKSQNNNKHSQKAVKVKS